MAWFVTVEYKDHELGTYWSPQFLPIQSEMERFEGLGIVLAKEIEAKYMAGPHNRQSVDYPWFGGAHDYPSLMLGWRWPMPDRPFQMQLAKQEGEIVDIVSTPFGSWAISQRVIDMIEAIEPGVHQYLAFEMLNPNGSVHPAKRWLLNVCSRAECVDTEKSKLRWLAAPSNHRFSIQFDAGYLIVKAEEARRRAIWCEWRYERFREPLVSDIFWNAIKSAGLHGWQPAYATDHVKEL